MLYDVTIIGGGIVGAATAWQLKQQYPTKKILLLEKEQQPALHQTGRNSGVIHAGVYYAPGSLKAEYCRQGVEETIAFCEQNNIAYQQCGKLLVATNEVEQKRLEALYQRCEQNQLQPQLLSQAQLILKEPNIQGREAIFVKQTGIVDYSLVTKAMLEQFSKAGGHVMYGQQVTSLRESPVHIDVATQDNRFNTRLMVACAGLMADRLISMLGIEPDFQIIPFRGEYFRLPEKYNDIVKHLIYPIPDPELPFLGVHLTRMIDGSVTVGPNAVLAFKREGYNKTDFSLKDMQQMLSFSGFWPLIKANANSGLQEFKNSCYKAGYLELVRKYCPRIQLQDLQSYPSGVRAQAVSKQGELIHDFKFVETEHSLHVGNAPSPAATSAIPIAKAIMEKLRHKL